MNVLALVGSPRKGGNTDLLVDQVIRGAGSQNQEIDIEKIYVNDLELKPCQGDQSCLATGRCIISDDMAAVLEKIKQADALILGSPLYRGYLPGQMKVFMDRTSPLERAVDVERMKKTGNGMRAMGLLMRIVPKKVQIMMMEKMVGEMGHFYRLEGKKNSVVVVVGAHPSYIPVMKRDLERTAEELGSFSFMSGGKVVSSVLVPGVSKKGDVLEKKEYLEKAFEAGRKLVS